MSPVFEDHFSELQADMVAICLEYVQSEAEDIYIYCSYESKMYAFDVFYKINGQYVSKHNLNNAVHNTSREGKRAFSYDTSEQRQEALLDIGLDKLTKIHDVCKLYEREMPTEIKLHYNVKQNSLRGKFRYDLVYSNDNELLPVDIFDSWFEEVKDENLD
ncbi:hypothetical protein N781_08860 [Pontibacillus halophilus JSM 076056 = DSM 19796]|uniref:DUF600 domain-containing protein n=1 Tax=Pontibacillus halophilus JSM 076056 = DSM 19796 TaxID=1385510 RepID=A0A0A5G9Z0_9BACI|nr:hypothetical protein [Pontibacillus halophilus]KGX89976.1 hypothetical protein N781_08860 [Pontibacillus halophilus JSM 076056 = DSM 19796]